MFQRFTVVMEYQQKPVLPPPLIAFCHFYSLLRYLIRKAKGLQQSRDNGLKLFLEKEDMERLYDFEEECVEGYFREQDALLQQSTEERIKNTDERVENMSQKIEDINQKENMQSATVQNIEFRLRKVEESADQILSHLAVIHRFMSTHTQLQDNLNGSTENVNALVGPGGGSITFDTRARTISESDSNTAPLQPRRRINRSLTEVRPDAYIFDDGMHFEVRTVPEENESDRSPEKSLAVRKILAWNICANYIPLPFRCPMIESYPCARKIPKCSYLNRRGCPQPNQPALQAPTPRSKLLS